MLHDATGATTHKQLEVKQTLRAAFYVALRMLTAALASVSATPYTAVGWAHMIHIHSAGSSHC